MNKLAACSRAVETLGTFAFGKKRLRTHYPVAPLVEVN